MEDRISGALLEKYWDINLMDEWWEHIFTCFKDDMSNVGIEVDRMYFSGFWSQGDGACFEGRVGNWPLFLKSLGYTDKILVEHAALYWSFNAAHRGRYYHEHSISFGGDLPLPDYEQDKSSFIAEYSPYHVDDLRSQAWYAVLEFFDNAKLEKEFIEAFKDHMRVLYKQLAEEFEYLTSAEAVADTIRANELHIGESDGDGDGDE